MSELKWVIMMGLSGLCACGNSNTVEISATGITSGNVRIVSLSSHQVVAEKSIEGGRAQFGIAELGLDSFELEILNSEGGFLSAIVASDFLENEIQVNPLTTLASCRFKKVVSDTSPLNGQIRSQNQLISKQFQLSDLQTIRPNLDFKKMNDFKESDLYGILLGGFEQLANDQKQSVLALTKLLCDDVEFDGVFNAVSSQGIIQQVHPLFDEQVLKLGYAHAIFDFAQKEIPLVAKLPIVGFSNGISISAVSGLFSPSIVNYSFDQ